MILDQNGKHSLFQMYVVCILLFLLLHLFLCHDVDFMLGESFFWKCFPFFCFACLASALVRGMSARAMVLAKRFTFMFLL